MQQYRNEKKVIEEAVAKVREVVRTASKNDIILALHNFDFDVNKTIQAFCDGSSNHICFERKLFHRFEFKFRSLYSSKLEGCVS